MLLEAEKSKTGESHLAMNLMKLQLVAKQKGA